MLNMINYNINQISEESAIAGCIYISICLEFS